MKDSQEGVSLEPAMMREFEEKHEKRSSHGEIVRDVIIGFADGLTVPFALTAGLSSLGSAHLVVIGGLAELFSGAISMGLGAYLAAVTERSHYIAEEQRERRVVLDEPGADRDVIYRILKEYKINYQVSTAFVQALEQNQDMWIKFIMDCDLKLQKPNISRAYVSAITMGGSYFIGGLIPMIPYFAMQNVTHALFVSIGITTVMLTVFGFIKNWVMIGTKRSGIYGALQTLVVGTLAAGASYGIVRALDSRYSA